MSATEELASCYRFAYEQLRRPDCPVAIPAEMGAFVHHPRLTPRACSVAHRAIETNSALRRHLAETSTVALVGQAGWAWLNDTDQLSAQVIDLRAALVERDQQLARAQDQLVALHLELANL